jgi:signal peptidase I
MKNQNYEITKDDSQDIVQDTIQKVTWKQELFSWIKILVLALVIGMAISSIIKPTLVSGVSMYPTLDDSDYLILNRVAYKMNEPTHGDIVVFNSHLKEERILIKRVIATEGEKITIKDGKVFVNDTLIDEVYLHGILTDGDIDAIVPKNKVFVMGDNRANSLDSRRSEVGFVDKKEIIGKVWFRLMPFKMNV